MTKNKSSVLTQLYGEDESNRVFDMLEHLDPTLNAIVQKIAYDYFWALPGLSIRDKSMVTVVILLAQEKEAQTRPHLIGFLNTGGSPEILMGIFNYLETHLEIKIAARGFLMLQEVLKTLDRTSEMDALAKLLAQPSQSLSTQEKNWITVIAAVALGQTARMQEAIQTYLNAGLPESTLHQTLIHMIVYCGFPTSINGFFALKKVLDENKFESPEMVRMG